MREKYDKHTENRAREYENTKTCSFLNFKTFFLSKNISDPGLK